MDKNETWFGVNKIDKSFDGTIKVVIGDFTIRLSLEMLEDYQTTFGMERGMNELADLISLQEGDRLGRLNVREVIKEKIIDALKEAGFNAG